MGLLWKKPFAMFLEGFCNTACDDQKQLLDPKQKKIEYLEIIKYIKITIGSVSVIRRNTAYEVITEIRFKSFLNSMVIAFPNCICNCKIIASYYRQWGEN